MAERLDIERLERARATALLEYRCVTRTGMAAAVAQGAAATRLAATTLSDPEVTRIRPNGSTDPTRTRLCHPHPRIGQSPTSLETVAWTVRPSCPFRTLTLDDATGYFGRGTVTVRTGSVTVVVTVLVVVTGFVAVTALAEMYPPKPTRRASNTVSLAFVPSLVSSHNQRQ